MQVLNDLLAQVLRLLWDWVDSRCRWRLLVSEHPVQAGRSKGTRFHKFGPRTHNCLALLVTTINYRALVHRLDGTTPFHLHSLITLS